VSRKSRSIELSSLPTERPNPQSVDLDSLSALEIARIINREDDRVATAVSRALPEIAHAIDVVAATLRKNGRVIYVGAGTSGRIAALDAAEWQPTFGTDARTVQFVIAGGTKALGAAVEASEDSRELGKTELAKKRPGPRDVVIGIAASGRTPFTVAALEYAKQKRAQTIAVTCNRDSQLERVAHFAIVTEVGPEVVSGSTRMKAGTAEKMVLNMISSGAMARLGYVYGNLMVNLHLKNEKLHHRAVGILCRAAGVNRTEAEQALKEADNRVAVALVMLRAQVNRKTAERILKGQSGHVRRAIAAALKG